MKQAPRCFLRCFLRCSLRALTLLLTGRPGAITRVKSPCCWSSLILWSLHMPFSLALCFVFVLVSLGGFLLAPQLSYILSSLRPVVILFLYLGSTRTHYTLLSPFIQPSSFKSHPKYQFLREAAPHTAPPQLVGLSVTCFYLPVLYLRIVCHNLQFRI